MEGPDAAKFNHYKELKKSSKGVYPIGHYYFNISLTKYKEYHNTFGEINFLSGLTYPDANGCVFIVDWLA